ncbi:MAG: ABC transporter permease [Nostoc sp. ChiSLP02]|nr:ABC transporter permease [Nostoc sp. DedSLP05]MDZ8098024.1 ABC transporter permease [Nostoc sp. DedSLP01]MDZ8189200.1 ABC transporter permease [Nostoc sp. ChiSLP02]
MMLNLIDKIGDANPQLLRELKGRLKFFNVAIAVATSLLLQVVVFLYQLRELPNEKYSLLGTYCRLRPIYEQRQREVYRQTDQSKINEFNNFLSNNFCPENQIDWQSWWRDHWEYIFLTLSVIFIFTLLVAGTYLLINDLAKEERRGTLNFIRLSPQSETSILTGKLLGVPSLIYLVVLAALPLHLWAGHSANIAFSHIFSYYAVIVSSCIFFYSSALLFGLVSRWFSGFQPWLGSGAVLFFLFMTMIIASSYSNSLNNSGAWLRLFNPWDVTNYLFPNLFRRSNDSPLTNLEFFYIPLGNSLVTVVGFHLFNYGVCTYGIFKAMKRCFRNPQASVISKTQSYIIVAFCQLMMWGFTLQYWDKLSDLDRQVERSFPLMALYNLALLFSSIAILSPHRQAVQDWARYRHQDSKKSIWWDLISSEKSPALVAIAINLIIVSIPWIVWISVASPSNTYHTPNWSGENFDRLKLLLALALSISMMLIYATIAQLILLLKTPKRSFWAIGTVGGMMFLPPMILELLGMSSWKHPTIWLFSTFPWSAIQYSGATTIFMAFIAELSVLALLNFRLTKQVKLAGESATKALLAGR